MHAEEFPADNYDEPRDGGAKGGEQPKWASPLLDGSMVDVKLLLSIAVKWADLGHACKPRAQHEQWTERVTAEFWALGDLERTLGVPISPLCDRDRDVDIPKSQLGFFKFIILPFYAVIADLVCPDMEPWRRVQANMLHWQQQAGEEPGRTSVAMTPPRKSTAGTPLSRMSTSPAKNHLFRLSTRTLAVGRSSSVSSELRVSQRATPAA